MTAEPIVLPGAPAEPSRPPLPLIAAIIPIVAGVVMWLVTGSILSLCFAFLGPLMIAGSFLDGVRRRRRDRRQSAQEADAAWRRAEEEIDAGLAAERDGLWARLPDVRRCLSQPPLREHTPVQASTSLVVGRGERTSDLRVSGGDGDRAREARARAARLEGAPLDVALGRGVCIRAEATLGAAIARALIVQLRLRFSSAQLRVLDDGSRQRSAIAPRMGVGPRTEAFRLATEGTLTEMMQADAMIRVQAPDEAVPDGITTVIEGSHPEAMTLRTTDGVRTIAVECLSTAQAALILRDVEKATGAPADLPDHVRRRDLPDLPATGLLAAIGRGVDDIVAVDLVADGPHAIVTGMTGAGKSELLITWITAMAQNRTPEEVVFVLADFKGGTAFDPLRALPHVVAVLTDLDDAGAERGVRSLRAELRRREEVLARSGARDIVDVDLPRLVIVIDEFAALLNEHPDLAAVFTDLAARGRALGMHLILGTQRAAGVIRDAVAANCPLRMSLRVADRADSRLVIGSDAAAELPGGAASRGVACVRLPQDAEARPVRIALTDAADLRDVAMRTAGMSRPRSPWLPPLPRLAPLHAFDDPGRGRLVLGRADDPDRQDQPVVTLAPGRDRGLAIIGGPGSGKTAALRALRAQHSEAVVLPSDPEGAWDALQSLASGAPSGSVILGDDIDRVLAELPGEYAQTAAAHLEALVRSARGSLVVLTASHTRGPAGRVVEAMSRRMLLNLPTRAEHFAAGGDGATFFERPPGRGHFAGREIQIAWVDEDLAPRAQVSSSVLWAPTHTSTGIVCTSPVRVATTLHARFPRHRVMQIDQAATDTTTETTSDASGVIIVGDADGWQREWMLTQRVRATGEMLVTAELPTVLRTLLGARELPPFALSHADRAWSVESGSLPRRVLLPTGQNGSTP